MTPTVLRAQLCDLIRERGFDPVAQPEQARELIDQLLHSWEERAVAGLVEPLPDTQATATFLLNEVSGLGALQPLLDDPEIEEIWINEPSKVFVSRGGTSELTTVMLTEQNVRDLVEKMLRSSGRRIDMSSPFVDAALATGERLHVAIPPVTGEHWSVNIRKHRRQRIRLSHLVQWGSLTPSAAQFLEAAVVAGLNILVAGATQAGKTTMVKAMAAAIPTAQRVVTCEEVFELSLHNRDCVALQTRSANVEGSGEIPLRRLIKEALRMRPDRLIVGEVREAEAMDLLIALNSGLPGMSTIHANSAKEALNKMCTLPLLAGENVSAKFVVPAVAQAIDIVVYLSLSRQGKRQVEEILSVTGRVENQILETAPIYVRDADQLVRGNGFIDDQTRFTRAGYDLVALLQTGNSPQEG